VLTLAPMGQLVLTAHADTPVQGDTNDTRNLPAADNPNSGFGNLSPEVQASAAAVANNTQTPQQQAAAAQQQGGTLPKSNCALASGGSLTSGGDWAQCITDVVYVFTI